MSAADIVCEESLELDFRPSDLFSDFFDVFWQFSDFCKSWRKLLKNFLYAKCVLDFSGSALGCNWIIAGFSRL